MRLVLVSPPAALLVDAARCWRRACDLGDPVQPMLAACLRIPGGALLAPAIDGLLRLYEAAFRRRFDAGAPCDSELTRDEEQLLGLLEHAEFAVPAGAGPGLAGAMRTAVRSTQLMLASLLPARPVPG